MIITSGATSWENLCNFERFSMVIVSCSHQDKMNESIITAHYCLQNVGHFVQGEIVTPKRWQHEVIVWITEGWSLLNAVLTHWPLGNLNEIFRHVIFKQILVIDGWGISCEIVLLWISLDFTDGQSTLVRVMAWCRQATSHYLSQCWPWTPVAIWCHYPTMSWWIIKPKWIN